MGRRIAGQSVYNEPAAIADFSLVQVTGAFAGYAHPAIGVSRRSLQAIENMNVRHSFFAFSCVDEQLGLRETSTRRRGFRPGSWLSSLAVISLHQRALNVSLEIEKPSPDAKALLGLPSLSEGHHIYSEVHGGTDFGSGVHSGGPKEGSTFRPCANITLEHVQKHLPASNDLMITFYAVLETSRSEGPQLQHPLGPEKSIRKTDFIL